MKRLTLLLLLMVCSMSARGQFVFPAMGARQGGMGGCTTALDGYGAATMNVAAWAWQQNVTVGLGMRNTGLLKPLSYGEIAIGVPTNHAGTFALSFDHYGTATYFEQQLAAAYALGGKHIAIGVRLDYLHSGTDDPYYSPLHQLSFAAGIQAKVGQRLTLGFRTSHLDIYNLGIAYRLGDNLMATVETEYQQTLRLRAGLEYSWNRMFYARMGYATQPARYTFGLGYRQHHFACDIAFQLMQPIGTTMQLSVNYLF